MTAPAGVASRRDVQTHTAVCAAPTAGRSFRDPCACRHMRLRHLDCEHKPIPAGPGRSCSGRVAAGPCRDCGCTVFTLRAEEATHA